MKNLAYLFFWALLFFVMMRFGCGAHMMGHRHHGRRSEGDKLQEPSQARDLVCGMMVDTATAKSTLHAGRPYHFCSERCRSTFEGSPHTYVEGARTQTMGAHHGTA